MEAAKLIGIGERFLVAALGLTIGCRIGDRPPGRPPGEVAARASVSETEAVRRAEAFVIANGYTDLPATKAGEELSRESIDDTAPSDRLEKRHNLLRRPACGVMRGTFPGGDPGWTVVFCYNPDNPTAREASPDFDKAVRELGRPVVMDPDGSALRMLHLQVLLDAPGLRRF
jgi:hypothetical protein